MTTFILWGLTVGLPCLFIGWALSTVSWGKANELVQETTNELPQWDNPFHWDEMPLTKNCQDCQDEQEQTL